MIDGFSIKFGDYDTKAALLAKDIFKKDDSEELDHERKEEFHIFVAKGLFACRRARPDIHLAVAVLTTRVKNPNEKDWKS